MALRRFLLSVVALGLLVGPARATWSIVVVNKATGEVCVASATCLGNKFPLKRWLPVIVVGKGAAAAQSQLDSSGNNRLLIWDGIHAGLVPGRILEELAAFDGGHQTRQYGIVTFDGAPVTFTGTGAGEAKLGVVGETDELIYAIQGNVLAGDPVVHMAEAALLGTDGDLGQRVMAAMEAARAMGGDGRCSCGNDPDGCGSPPPDFDKSAHTAFIVLARLGDKDGVCNKAEGCASGGYYMSLVVKGKESDPDPVLELEGKYADWRAGLDDVADHVLSEFHVDRTSLVADGRDRAQVRIRLRDLDGDPLTSGGHKWQVRWVGEGEPTAIPGEVEDLGGGLYHFELTSTAVVGRGAWVLRCKRPGDKWVQLARPLVLPSETVLPLHAGLEAVEGESLPFTLNLGADHAGLAYRLLGSTSGSWPGTPLGNVVIPLNRDRFFNWTWSGAAGFQGSIGLLDGEGRAEALLDGPGAGWGALAGSTLSFSALIGGPTFEVTNVVQVEVLP